MEEIFPIEFVILRLEKGIEKGNEDKFVFKRKEANAYSYQISQVTLWTGVIFIICSCIVQAGNKMRVCSMIGNQVPSKYELRVT